MRTIACLGFFHAPGAEPDLRWRSVLQREAMELIDEVRSPQMSTSWYIDKSGRELGPYSSNQMMELAAAGQLKSDDLVRRADQTTPVAARKIRGTFPEGQTRKSPKTTAAPVSSENNQGERKQVPIHSKPLDELAISGASRRSSSQSSANLKHDGEAAVTAICRRCGMCLPPTGTFCFYCRREVDALPVSGQPVTDNLGHTSAMSREAPRPLWVGLAIFIFGPLGLYLLRKHPALNLTRKLIGLAWVFTGWLFVFAGTFALLAFRVQLWLR